MVGENGTGGRAHALHQLETFLSFVTHSACGWCCPCATSASHDSSATPLQHTLYDLDLVQALRCASDSLPVTLARFALIAQVLVRYEFCRLLWPCEVTLSPAVLFQVACWCQLCTTTTCERSHAAGLKRNQTRTVRDSLYLFGKTYSPLPTALINSF